jgi:hypothetical protein
MPPELNVYSPIVRKLWSKMRDTEWRVVLKSLYALHKLSTDGSMAQATNLKVSTMHTINAYNLLCYMYSLISMCSCAMLCNFLVFLHCYDHRVQWNCCLNRMIQNVNLSAITSI